MLALCAFISLFGLALSAFVSSGSNAGSKVQAGNAPAPTATGSIEKRFSPNPVELAQKSLKVSTQETEAIFQRWKKILSGLGAFATGIKIGKDELVVGKTHRLYYEITYTSGTTPTNINTAISQFDKSLATEPIPGVSPMTPAKPGKPGASADVVLD